MKSQDFYKCIVVYSTKTDAAKQNFKRRTSTFMTEQSALNYCSFVSQRFRNSGYSFEIRVEKVSIIKTEVEL